MTYRKNVIYFLVNRGNDFIIMLDTKYFFFILIRDKYIDRVCSVKENYKTLVIVTVFDKFLDESH